MLIADLCLRTLVKVNDQNFNILSSVESTHPHNPFLNFFMISVSIAI